MDEYDDYAEMTDDADYLTDPDVVLILCITPITRRSAVVQFRLHHKQSDITYTDPAVVVAVD